MGKLKAISLWLRVTLSTLTVTVVAMEGLVYLETLSILGE